MAEKSPAPTDNYSLASDHEVAEIPAPTLPYKPRDPSKYKPAIGIIACGGITESHLTAYKQAGYNVVMLCDLIEERAAKRQQQFYPNADITTDYRQLLARKDIEVVDIATHPAERLPLIEAALSSGKHVLSQKPFVLNIDDGARLVALARARGLKLAVNQNGRWAPHFSFIRHAVRGGLIGDVISIHQAVHWDHTWTMGTRFEDIDDLVLYDFAIHWFDIVSHLLGDRRWLSVFATKTRAIGQKARPPMLAQVLIDFEGGQASLVFDAHLKYDARDTTYVGGTIGSIRSEGANLGEQHITLTTAAGVSHPQLEGSWFPDGFHGTMGELICAIEENREPTNGAEENLKSLELCFAAIASANDGMPKRPGEIRSVNSRS